VFAPDEAQMAACPGTSLKRAWKDGAQPCASINIIPILIRPHLQRTENSPSKLEVRQQVHAEKNRSRPLPRQAQQDAEQVVGHQMERLHGRRNIH